MMPQIMHWLSTVAQEHLSPEISVVEIGSRNINGRARDAIPHSQWTGWDTEPGEGVEVVGKFRDMDKNYDLVIACECYEHDKVFWWTNWEARKVVARSRGFYLITTPALGFPYHSYGGDFYRFTEDTYREIFFEKLKILDLRTIGHGNQQTVCGIAQVP